MDLKLRYFCILLCLFLTSCASVNTPLPSNESERQQLWNQLQQTNGEMISWGLKGKIGIKAGKKGGSATLNWSYVSNNQDIELYGPFGGGRVKIKAVEDSATLRDTKGRVIQGDSAEQVLYKRLGWHVPFDELIMWSRGLPNNGATDIEIDDRGRLLSLKQGIWHVEYQEHRVTNDLTLPRKLTITALPGAMEVYDDDGNYLGDELQVKVILKRWWDIKFG